MQDRPQPPPQRAGGRRAGVDDNAGDRLPGLRPQHAGLRFVHAEAMLDGEVANAGEQRADRAGRIVGAEGQVVGVAGVRPAGRGGEAGQVAVEVRRDRVGQTRRGAGPLRQRPLAERDVLHLPGVPHPAAGRLGGQQPGHGGRGGRVAQRRQVAADAAKRNRPEEVGQVAVDDDRPADVQPGSGEGAAAADEPVGGVLHRQPADELLEQCPLGGGEPRLGGGERPRAAGPLGHLEPGVVRGRRGRVGKRQPPQRGDVQIERGGDIGRRAPDGQFTSGERGGVGRAVGQAVRDAPAEIDDVGRPAMRDGGPVGGLPLGGGGLLFRLDAGAVGVALLAGGGDRVATDGVGIVPADLVAQPVHLGQVGFGQQPAADHAAVDQLRLRVGRRGDAVAAEGPPVPAGGAQLTGRGGDLGVAHRSVRAQFDRPQRGRLLGRS